MSELGLRQFSQELNTPTPPDIILINKLAKLEAQKVDDPKKFKKINPRQSTEH